MLSTATTSTDPRAAAVLPALAAAAERTGADFTALYQTARVESGFNPSARAGTSSATGLFQFVDSTWLRVLDRHGAAHGIAPATREDALALRRDPYVAALMAAEHMADNRALLERELGRPATNVDLYLAHFLGAGGAARFLGAMAADPSQPAAALMPAAAQANRAIFYDGAAPRSIAAVHALLAGRLGAGGTPVPQPTAFAGTTVPDSAPAPDADAAALLAAVAPGLLDHLPPDLAALVAARAGAGSAPGAPTPADPRLAAQAAYLILADLGA
jgi:hypothetical protein